MAGKPGTAPRNKGKGKAYLWIRKHAGHAGDDCLLWPFARGAHGYGTLGINGKVKKAHRVMCETAHGAPPTEQHQAAHSCGNTGCVNPRHLSWKTVSENAQDRVAMGNQMKAGRKRAILTREQASEIRALKGLVSHTLLATAYGVSTQTISHIHTGRVWARKSSPSRPSRALPPAERERKTRQAQTLRATGETYQAIGEKLGISKVTASKYANAAR